MSIKLHIQGMFNDIEAFSHILNDIVDVLDESENYANRGKSQFVRRHLDVALPTITLHITHFDVETAKSSSQWK